MASSTRKWRKQQKEYNRRRRQATRRAEEAAEKQRENERMKKLQAALGVTAAQGFGRNIFSGILASSKGQQENYLTASLREKRLAEAPRLRHLKQMRNKLQKYEEYPYIYNSKLMFAVSEMDPDLVQYILEQGDTNINLEDQTTRITALESVLRYLLEINMTYNEYSEYNDQEKYEKLHQILSILMNAGATIRAKTLTLFWQQPPSEIQYLLDTFPIFKEKTIEFQAQILLMLHEDITDIEHDIHEIGLEVEFVRNGENSGYYPVRVPDSYYTELDALHASIYNLRRFLETYNSKSGEYSLE
jgi:Icc-related predicted phosphoesterase